MVASSDRDSQRDLMRRKREGERGISVAPVADKVRRAACEADVYLFLKTYFGHLFTHDFTDQQRAMIETILYRARHGGDKAIAAPRGEGKTTIAICVAIYCLFLGIVKFPVILSANGPDAKRVLGNLKAELEFNELLAEDFPEICAPIRALAGAPQRCNMQTFEGERTRLRWADDFVQFARVPKSKASGSIIATRGMDAAIRGMNIGGQRPDLALIEDVETEESARSDPAIKKHENLIDKDIAGLAGQDGKIARVMLTTVQNEKCVSAKYTDPNQKPSWSGVRFKLLEKEPERMELWEEYMRLRENARQRLPIESRDDNAREAHQFYLDNREEMDRGAIVGNPNRFDSSLLPDGSEKQVSTLQGCFDFIADNGWPAFHSEKQNSPQDTEAHETSGITATLIRSRLNGLDLQELPAGTTHLTAAIDIGKRACHWAVTAWAAGATGCVVEYGVQEVYSSDLPESGIDKAILCALNDWRELMIAEPYQLAGKPIEFSLVLIDAGNWDQAVYEFCRTSGMPFRASKGVGDGARHQSFHQPNKIVSPTRWAGDHWFAQEQEQAQVWLFSLDTDYWKNFVHQRFITRTFDDDGRLMPGSLSLYGGFDSKNERNESERRHFAFSKHLTAETRIEEFVPDKGLKTSWKKTSRNNHYFDCVYMCCAAAAISGVDLFRKPVVVQTSPDVPLSRTIRRPDRKDWIRRRA